MEWIRRTDKDRFLRGRRSIDENKAVWVVFSHERNGKFFRLLGENYLELFSDLEIAVLWRTPFYACISIPPEQILLDRSDLVFLDAAFLIEVEDVNRGPLLAHSSRLGFLFYEDPSQLRRISQLLADDRNRWGKEKAAPTLWDYYPDRERILQFDPTDAEKEVGRITGILAPMIEDLYQSKLFLCHASEDWQEAESIARSLGQRGIPVWYDRWSMRVGDSIADKIGQGIGDCRFMAVIFSKNSVDKPWCKRELNAALQKQLKDQSLIILPVLIDECELPPLFQDIKYADFRKSPEEGLKQLTEAIRQHLRETDSRSEQSLRPMK